MASDIKNVAIIGANKEGLKLLPILLNDKKTRVRAIVDSNRDAMLFKLNELGYRLSKNLDIKVSNSPDDIKKITDLDIIINALQDTATEKFLESPEFRDVEKLGPLSTRLIWGVRASAKTGVSGHVTAGEQTSLLTALREIVDAVRLTIDRKELLSVVLKLATESIRAERGSIMLLSPEEGTLRVEIAKGMDEEVVRKIRVPIGTGVSGKVAKEGKPLLISGKADSSAFTRPMDRTDVKSAMCVPLVVNGEIIGVVNVSSSESAHAFTNDDLNFLTSLAGLAAEVIQRSNEYERLRVDAAKFAFWKEVDSIMSSAQPLDKRLNATAKRLVQIIAGLTCFIYVYDEEAGRLVLRASSIRDSKGMGLLTLRPGEGIEGSSLESMKDAILVDRTEEGAAKRIYVSLPMVANNTLVGSFNGHIVSARGLSIYHESFLKEIRTLLAESIYKYKQEERERQKSRKFFAVDEAGLEMISVADPKRLYPIIATTPAAIIGAEGSLLRIKQKETNRFQTAATFGLDDKNIRDYFLPIERDTVMEVLRKKETVAREFSEEASPYIRSILSQPLKLDEKVIGVITFFNKTAEGTVQPCAFSKADSEVVKRFAVYGEKALANSIRAAVKDEGSPGVSTEEKREPEETRLTPLGLFEKRVEQELNRSRRYDKGLVLATVRIAGLKGPAFEALSDLEARLIGSIRKKTRSFDVVAKLNAETYGLLFLDTQEKITRPLDLITDIITADESFNRALEEGEIDVLYGYAMFPRDGDSFAELFSKASRRERLDIRKTLDTGI